MLWVLKRTVLMRELMATKIFILCHVAQSVMCLTADPGVVSLIPAESHTFAEIDREIIYTAILISSTDSKKAVASYMRKYVQEVLVDCLVKLAQEKSSVR